MRVLCICEHGNVRSVALAYILKTLYQHEAIAIGVADTTVYTRLMLYDWADLVIFLDKNLPLKLLPEELQSTFRILDVGKDIWHTPKAEELNHKLLKGLREFHHELIDNMVKK